MKKIIALTTILIIILFIILGFRFLLGGDEDTWICADGEWLKHGAPNALVPVEPCPKNNQPINCPNYSPSDCPSACVVCPPCPECSSIACQTEDFCASMGITRDWYQNIENKITDFETCLMAGNLILETYPRQCATADGQRFIENIGNELEKQDLIMLDEPRPNSTLESPQRVSGRARGSWFFEGTFPITLVNWDGLIIAEGYVTAEGDWMTDHFVQFNGEIVFDKVDTAVSNRGALILRKDNPSGLPQNDDALEIPIKF